MMILCPTNLEMALGHPQSVLGVFICLLASGFKEESDFSESSSSESVKVSSNIRVGAAKERFSVSKHFKWNCKNG